MQFVDLVLAGMNSDRLSSARGIPLRGLLWQIKMGLKFGTRVIVGIREFRN